MNKKLLVLILTAGPILAGCSAAPERVEPTSNSGAKVRVLFTDKDGYTLKYAEGYRVYYVTPGPARTKWTTSETHFDAATKTNQTTTTDHETITSEEK